MSRFWLGEGKTFEKRRRQGSGVEKLNTWWPRHSCRALSAKLKVCEKKERKVGFEHLLDIGATWLRLKWVGACEQAVVVEGEEEAGKV